MVIHVEDEVLTHYGEADEADVTGGVWHDELRKLGRSPWHFALLEKDKPEV
jgi:hypothetical protein